MLQSNVGAPVHIWFIYVPLGIQEHLCRCLCICNMWLNLCLSPCVWMHVLVRTVCACSLGCMWVCACLQHCVHVYVCACRCICTPVYKNACIYNGWVCTQMIYVPHQCVYMCICVCAHWVCMMVYLCLQRPTETASPL